MFYKISTLFYSHCAIKVKIRSFFWPVFSHIQSKYGKIRTRKNSVFGHFLRSESRKTNKLESLLGKVEGCRIFLNSDSQPNTLSWEICVNVCVHRYVLAIVALHRIAVPNIFRKFLRKPPCMESLLLNLQDVRLCQIT